jgi:serine/threonine protein kinase
MSWINSRQFTISNRNGRHYVFRRNSAGNTEINIPANIVSKGQATAWLKAHPDKVANPTRFKPKRGAPQPGGLKPFERIVTGKKMIAFVNKARKEYLRPAPGPEPNYFINRMRAEGKNIPMKFTCEGLKRDLKKRTILGKGRQGIVFLGSRYSNGRYPFAIKVAPFDLRAARAREKQPAVVEFTIHKAAHAAAPEGVVAVHQLIDCSNFVNPSEIDMANVQSASNYNKSKQSVILMEYCPDGSLKKWIDGASRSDGDIMAAIARILMTLKKIKAVHPYFNHNDLHLENIFMSKRGPLIGDFGWARLEKNGTNPAVNKANGTKTADFWGVGPKTDTRYDHHLILNEIRDLLVRRGGVSKYPTSLAFLDMAVPVGYRGSKDTHVSEWRLKYDDPCPDLPSLTRLISKLTKKIVTSPNLVAARRRLKKVGAPKKLVTSANLRAARARLRKVGPKKVFTNSELLKMSAANFLKLSPNTRALAMGIRKGKAAVNPVPKPLVNNTKRVPIRAAGPAPMKARKPIPSAILKSSKFNKLVTKIWTNQGAIGGGNFNNAWNKARKVALNRVQARINNNKAPFTPSPPKPKAKTPSPPKPKPKAPSPPKPKPKAPSPPNPKVRPNFRLSPSSGRAKIQSKNSGRWVYANLHYSMDELKALAARLNVSVKGLRSKANIAKKLFG